MPLRGRPSELRDRPTQSTAWRKPGTTISTRLSKAIRIPELSEVLTRVRLLDPGVREVLDAQRDLMLAVSTEGAADADVVGKVEARREPLAPSLVHRRRERCANAKLAEPCRSSFVGPIAKRRNSPELAKPRRATPIHRRIGPAGERDLPVALDLPAGDRPSSIPIPRQTGRRLARVTARSCLHEDGRRKECRLGERQFDGSDADRESSKIAASASARRRTWPERLRASRYRR